ncbi:MAG: DUF1761 domain-containing protein [Methanobacteriota archaeon]
MAFEPEFNVVGMAAGIVATFILGWLWYGPIFGKRWAAELGIDMSKKPTMGAMAVPIVGQLVGTILLVAVFAHVMEAFWAAGEEANLMTALEGAGWTWLGFFLPVQAGRALWESRSWGFVAIGAAYHLVALALVAALYLYV